MQCERCGWAHVCGDDCDAGVLDPGSELSVCPISGYCFDRMMSEWEVRTLYPPIFLASKQLTRLSDKKEDISNCIRVALTASLLDNEWANASVYHSLLPLFPCAKVQPLC